MNTFLKVSSKDASTLFFNLDGNNRRLEVLVLYLSKKFFLPKLIDSKDVSDTRYQTSTIFPESKRYIFTRSRMNQLELGAVLNELVGLYETEGAGPRRKLHINACAQDKISVSTLPPTQCRTDKMREHYLIICKFFQIKSLQAVRIHYPDA